MLDNMIAERAKERHERLIREAESFRRALRSKKVRKTSPLLKTLILLLVAVA